MISCVANHFLNYPHCRLNQDGLSMRQPSHASAPRLHTIASETVVSRLRGLVGPEGTGVALERLLHLVGAAGNPGASPVVISRDMLYGFFSLTAPAGKPLSLRAYWYETGHGSQRCRVVSKIDKV